MSIDIVSAGTKLSLSEINGAARALDYHGNQLLAPADESFSLLFRDRNRDLLTLKSSEFSDFSGDKDELTFSAHAHYPTLSVKIAIRAEDGFFYFRPSVTGIPEEIILERIDAPQLKVENNGKLFWPHSEGVLVSNPLEFPFTQVSFPNNGSGYYPGICQTQFMAHYSDQGGVYFAAHDITHTTKTIGYGNDGNDLIQLHLETFCGSNELAEYHSEFEYVIGAFQGDWMDAAEIYRDWALNHDPALAEKPVMPDWVSESPVIVIHPVRGTGTISAEPNEYFPYENAMPIIRDLAEKFDSKILSHLMRWDCHAPWAPPYIWPPMGGKESLLRYRDMLREEGHYLGLYGSGTSWTLKSKTNGYSTEEQFEREGLEKVMTRGPKGEIDATLCGWIRHGMGMCITEKFCRDLLRDQVKQIAETNIELLQFFDQNLGGASFLCYSEEHNHPSSPGRWQTEAMKSLVAEMLDDIKSVDSETILGTECAAAQPYLNGMSFNDLRSVFCLLIGMPVPAYQFIFHEYSNNFMGNQADVTKKLDCEACPENLLWRVAYAFNAGALLTVTLRDKGIIDWGAAADWDSVPPDQETVITLIRNLNQTRKDYPRFLQHGKMLKPIMDVTGDQYTLRFKNRIETIDAFTHSCWEAPTGERAQIITNFLPKTLTVNCQLPSERQARVDGQTRTGAFSLEIPALSAIVVPLD